MGSSAEEVLRSGAYHSSDDTTLYSSSLPVLPYPKLSLNELEQGHKPVHDSSSSLIKLQPGIKANEFFESVEDQAIGSFLPDDEDELLAGIMDGFDLGGLSHRVDDLEDDLFGSGGGLELESDLQENMSFGISRISLSDAVASNGTAPYGVSNGAVSVAGEHPLGEHPSRTLFVRNINSNVEDAELRSLFEQYGDIRTLYTACKHRGFVMISYYDIRDARSAMRELQNKPLRRRKLDIHFSIPKDNPSDKDLNQGTLVAFNLHPSVSNDDLRQIFGAYGEIKEIRETPHKRHHKFIEFYDVRAAEAALRSLNRSDIAGKRIKLEPSRPGGARRSLMLQLNQDLENEDSRNFLHQISSSIANSPPGNWPQFSSPLEHRPLSSLSKSPGHSSLSPTPNKNLPGLASILHPQTSNSMKVAPIGKDSLRSNRVEQILSNENPNHRNPFQLSLSFPEPRTSQYPGSISSYGASSSNGSCFETLSGPQFLWGSPKVYSEPDNFSSWRAQGVGHPFTSNGQKHGFPFSSRGSFIASSLGHHHLRNHVGSAPSGVTFERQYGFYQEPSDSYAGSNLGNVGFGHNDRGFMMNLGAPNSVSIPGNISENGSPGFSMMSSPGIAPFLSNGHFPAAAATVIEGFNDRGHARYVETNGNQMDNKKQFQLDLHKIKSGEDTRTTLMIKNIPNKYTSKMLLAAIDENHKGTYDFIYLPIDFKNKCNVGYAFINMLSPLHIIPFYEAFNGKKWEKFNSEKVASLAYARIQGNAALVAHFENSSLMNEDRRCRPILFRSEVSEYGDQVISEHFPSNCLNIQAHRLNDELPMNSMDTKKQDGSSSDEPKQR